MNIEKLHAVQELQIKMMESIHNICVENDISYYMIAGSALGAVRHKGFIPWDVDIDIAMLRKDYIKFKDVCKKKLPEELEYYDYESSKNFNPPHALVAYKGSRLINKYEEYNDRLHSYGIFIDVFPLDVAPDDKRLQQKQAKRISRLNDIKYYKLRPFTKEDTVVKHIVKKVLSFILSPISIHRINVMMQKEMQRYDGVGSYNLVCSMASHYSYCKQCMNIELYGKPKLVEFAGHKFYAPERIEEYLTKLYGDYMKLPSKEKQQEMIDYFVDASW